MEFGFTFEFQIEVQFTFSAPSLFSLMNSDLYYYERMEWYSTFSTERCCSLLWIFLQQSERKVKVDFRIHVVINNNWYGTLSEFFFSCRQPNNLPRGRFFSIVQLSSLLVMLGFCEFYNLEFSDRIIWDLFYWSLMSGSSKWSQYSNTETLSIVLPSTNFISLEVEIHVESFLVNLSRLNFICFVL